MPEFPELGAIGRAAATHDGALSRRHLMELAGTAIPVALAGCMGAQDGPSGADGTPTATTPTPPLPGTVQLSQSEGFVGDTIEVQASGLPANRELEVVWETVQGTWALIKAMNIVGPKYAPRTEPIARTRTDAQGRLSASYTIPEDYGGTHDVKVQTADGKPLAKESFTLLSSFEIDRTSAPMGETFTVSSHALGPNQFRTNYQLAWDNAYSGIFTAVSSRGHAEATLTAVGPPGKHLIEVHRGFLGLSFLVAKQSPFGDVIGGRTSHWVVEVTEPEGDLRRSWSPPLRDADPVPVFYPELERESEAELSVTPDHGVAGDAATITGRNFPANTEVDLVWYTITGSRVTSAPIEKVAKPDVLPRVRTDGNGAFSLDVEIPTDKGGTRPIVAEVDGEGVAVTGFVMQPKLVGMTKESGPIGTEFQVEMAGLGWTEYGNTYALLWDNQYLGYGCGMDEEGGVVKFDVTACGDPGPHFIDMYPAMYRADENPPDMYGGKAQLTYRYDHPGHPTPSLHFTFEVTE
jgi:hypothetical protein